jgi:hypothetical protein
MGNLMKLLSKLTAAALLAMHTIVINTPDYALVSSNA